MAKADIDKSRQELMDEIAELRTRLARAGQEPDQETKSRSLRVPLETEIELIADFDLLQARGVNLSETGIAFQTVHPLFFEMRFQYQGRVRRERARLVWMQTGQKGQSLLGLEFSQLEDIPEI